MEGTVNLDELFNTAEDCIKRALSHISEDDFVQLSALIAELKHFENLFANISASENHINVNLEALQFSKFFSDIIKEAEHIFGKHEEIHIAEASLPLEPYTGFGRPRKSIPAEEVLQLRNTGLSWARIAALLHVSSRTLKRRRTSLNLEGRERRTNITDDDLDLLIRDIKLEHPVAGYVYVWSSLKAKECFVTFKRLKERMRLIDPVGIFIRSRNRISRRKYKVKGAKYLWHMDGNEKLVHWKMYIHGCTDGYSRKIIYLSLAHNKLSTKVLNIFQQGVKLHGMPIRVRGDGGSENQLVNELMHACRPEVQSPFIIGRSVHNVRIERLWAEVNRVVSSKYKSIFLELENLGMLDEHSVLDLLCLSYVYFARIDRSLQNFIALWNNHPLSSEQSYSPNQLWSISIIKQRYSSNITLTHLPNMNSDSNNGAPANDYQLPNSHENNPLHFKHLSDFTHILPLDEIALFESAAMEIVPNPLLEDRQNGKSLYSTLRNHFVNE